MNANDTINAWEAVANDGARNSIRVAGTAWFWTPEPTRLKNGALCGRIHEKQVGEPPRDVGAFKIAADGSIESAPERFLSALSSVGFYQNRVPAERPESDYFSTDDLDADGPIETVDGEHEVDVTDGVI